MPPGSAGSLEAGVPASNAGTVLDSNAVTAASSGSSGTEAPAVRESAKGDAKKPAAKAPNTTTTHGGAKKSAPKVKPQAAPAKHHAVLTKHRAGTAQHYPNQVAHP